MCFLKDKLTGSESRATVSTVLIEVAVAGPRSVKLLCQYTQVGGSSLRSWHVALQRACHHQFHVFWTLIEALEYWNVL